ncbi:MAG: hypothetical protein Q8N62_07970 [Candidatus Omnitrophota bacterium]|nr:hypothetical protein [Candidatus Omnitrophota bacterium]
MRIAAIILIGVLLGFNLASAGIEFIPKEGKLWVEASGEVVILKSSPAEQEYFALKLEDARLYILSGELSGQLKKLAGKQAAIKGLLKARIVFEKKLIPSIEVKSVQEIAPRGKNE